MLFPAGSMGKAMVVKVTHDQALRASEGASSASFWMVPRMNNMYRVLGVLGILEDYRGGT